MHTNTGININANESGIIIGIDIGKDVSMATVFNEYDLSADHVVFTDGATFKTNPVSADRWPQIVSEGYQGQIDDVCAFFNVIIEQAKKMSGRIKVGMIAMTVYDFNSTLLDSIAVIMERLNIPREHWTVISHEEAYVYYAYNQKRELYNNGVMLLDYQPSGLMCYLCSDRKMTGKSVIMENSYMLTSDSINRAGAKDIPLSGVSREIIEWLTDILTDHYVASIYLTGSGFDVEQFPDELTRFLCNHRKVFAGQNIYVKGAAFCGYEQSYPLFAEQIIIACHNRIATGIEMDIVERGKPKRLRIVKPGTNWYEASRSFTFIASDLNELILYMKPCDGRDEYTETVDVSEIPFRPDKQTRIDVAFEFESDNKFAVKVSDRGFGDFVRSSGKVINEQFDIV